MTDIQQIVNFIAAASGVLFLGSVFVMLVYQWASGEMDG